MPRLEQPFTLWVQPTRACNLADCKLCYDGCTAKPTADELTYEQVVGLLDEGIENGVINVFFEGGEPFARADFLDMVRHTTPHAFVLVRTNGTLIDARIARELKEARVGIVCIDLLGATAETHDELTGVPGSFEQSLAGVRHVVAEGIETFLTCIMNRRNVHELQALLDLAGELGAAKVGVLRLYALGRARKAWGEFSLPLAEQEAALAALEPPPNVELMQSWHPNDPNCCWQSAAVDAFGNSIGCPYLREYANYGNVRDVPFMETWRHPLYEHLRKADVRDGCPSCANQGAPGGCRSSAYAFTGDWDAGDPTCREMNHGIDLTVLPQWLEELPIGPAPYSPAPAAHAEEVAE